MKIIGHFFFPEATRTATSDHPGRINAQRAPRACSPQARANAPPHTTHTAVHPGRMRATRPARPAADPREATQGAGAESTPAQRRRQAPRDGAHEEDAKAELEDRRCHGEAKLGVRRCHGDAKPEVRRCHGEAKRERHRRCSQEVVHRCQGKASQKVLRREHRPTPRPSQHLAIPSCPRRWSSFSAAKAQRHRQDIDTGPVVPEVK